MRNQKEEWGASQTYDAVICGTCVRLLLFRGAAIFIKNNLETVLANLLGFESDPNEKSKRHKEEWGASQTYDTFTCVTCIITCPSFTF